MSSSGFTWTHALIVAGGAAAAGGLVWYLLKDDKEETGAGGAKGQEKVNVDTVSKEKVLQILGEIIQSQERIKNLMKEITADLNKNKMTFDDTYKRVKHVQPEDPLEKYGLNMMDFDALLDKYQSDAGVRNAIAQIMGAPGMGAGAAAAPPKALNVDCKKLVEIHKFMLEELKRLVREFEALPTKNEYEMKTVTIAAQAIVGAKVESKFGLSTEEVEAAVIMNHQQLSMDADFARLNIEMQQTMAQLMGAPSYL